MLRKPLISRQGISGHAAFCLPVRQLLRGLGQRLEIAQGRIVKDVVLRDVATGLDSANLGDRIQHVQCIGLPRFGHNDTASSITRSLM